MEGGGSDSWLVVDKLYRDRLEAMAPTVVRLDAHDALGRTVDWGSGVCLQIDGVRVVATAEHVVFRLAKHGLIHVRVADQQEASIAQDRPFVAPIFPLDPATAILLQDRTGLDVAVIPASPALARRRCWIDGDLQRSVAEQIAARVLIHDDPWPVVLFGFPRFARFENEAIRVELVSAYPLFGRSCKRIDESPALVATTRAMVLDIDVPEYDPLGWGSDEFGCAIEQAFHRARIPNSDGDRRSVFAGYSGGPVFHFDWNGAAVAGLMTAGDVYESRGRVVAAPMDAVIDAVRAASDWPRLVN